jgi:glycosidase
MKYFSLAIILAGLTLAGCAPQQPASAPPPPQNKIVVYQVMTRLFGNTNTTNKPWGTLQENGVGKFNDFNDKALSELYNLGVTHIWYTGVPHHAVITDYTAYGITNDDPDVVKGRAGSPYAVKDYYNVNPDLAVEPAKRLEEFKALVERTHKHGMAVIIDIVPNHIARRYQGLSNPEGVADFGANDDTTVEYARNNNFYYVVGQPFVTPTPENNYKPLRGERHPLADGLFDENPAKWTGNGSRLAQPNFYDWYETVKINYGVKPDGSKDFDTIPAVIANKDWQSHYNFWKDKNVPDSWVKFRDIALYWIDFGVDGFRFDMAEMVPVEFWSYLSSCIKNKNPNAILLAEVYNPTLFRDYLHIGKLDYLYDKVDLYDTLKNIMQGKGNTDNLVAVQARLADIDPHMLRFLENHDEQRIASKPFAGDANIGKPAMVVSACLGKSPIMIYFGQEVGEPGNGNAGFGSESRTTIFDYWGVPNHQRWMNNGAFDGGQLTDNEKALRQFYQTLLTFVRSSSALMGQYAELQTLNRTQNPNYSNKLFAFARWSDTEKLLIVTNFSNTQTFTGNIYLTPELKAQWGLNDNNHKFTNVLGNNATYTFDSGNASVNITLEPLQSVILKLN